MQGIPERTKREPPVAGHRTKAMTEAIASASYNKKELCLAVGEFIKHFALTSFPVNDSGTSSIFKTQIIQMQQAGQMPHTHHPIYFPPFRRRRQSPRIAGH